MLTATPTIGIPSTSQYCGWRRKLAVGCLLPHMAGESPIAHRCRHRPTRSIPGGNGHRSRATRCPGQWSGRCSEPRAVPTAQDPTRPLRHPAAGPVDPRGGGAADALVRRHSRVQGSGLRVSGRVQVSAESSESQRASLGNPQQGGQLVRIHGLKFGEVDLTVIVRVGERKAQAKLNCSYPPRKIEQPWLISGESASLPANDRR